MKTNSFLLASTAVLVMAAVSPQALATDATDAPMRVAQAGPPPAPAPAPDNQEKPPSQPPHVAPPRAQPPRAAPPKPPAPPPPPAQHPAPPPQPPAPPPSAAPHPPAPPPVQAPPPPRTQAPPPPPPPHTQAPPPPPPAGAPARQERREDRRDQRQERRQAPPQQPAPPPAPPATAAPPHQQPAPPPAGAPARQERREERRDQRQEQRQAPPQQPAPPQAPPAAAPPPHQQPAPQNTFRGPAPSAPPQQAQPPQAQPQPTAPQQQRPRPQRGPAPPPPPPAATAPPPAQPRDAREFIRRDNQGPARTMDQVRGERQQTQQNGSTVIREGDRVIVRQGDRTVIRHSETDRFAVGARDVRVDRRGNQTFTVVQRPNNTTIINITGADGRLVRRVRRDAQGRQVVIIDNSFARPGRFIDPPPPVIRIPPERYIVDAWDAPPEAIFGVFAAPPVERLTQRYTLDDVRFSEPLRARMPRVDLDITFDSGAWQLSPEQVDRLSVVADGLNRAIARNPREVFLIEGHTDATGNPDDNLSLSDRRAEAVAVALTEQFGVPAENLVTQGYGEEYLKDPTDGPSRINRRVAVRRITPLIDQQAGGPPPR